MVSLSRISYGESPISSAKINAIIDTLSGAQNTPVSLTAANDPVNFALTVRNQDTAGKAVLLYKSDGATVLLQAQNSGVQVSPDGTAAAPAVSTTHTQTLTNKTLTSPTLTTPTLNGLLGGTSFTASNFTPALQQSTIVTLSSAIGRYMQLGKLIVAWVRVAASGAGTPGVAIAITGLPVAQAGFNNAWCFGTFSRAGNPNYTLVGQAASSTSVTFYSGNAATGLFGVNPAVTIASGDVVDVTFIYESV